jgi:hypothetical protein
MSSKQTQDSRLNDRAHGPLRITSVFRWILGRAATAQGPTTEQFEAQVADWESAAELATSDHGRARIFNRAGDHCIGAERRKAALEFYGRALDAYLDGGALDPATAVCRKILRHAPDAVRVHCTIACILIQHGDLEAARNEVRLYVQGARRLCNESLAVPRLRLIAAGVLNGEMKLFLAEQLRQLGDTVASRRIEESLGDERQNERYRSSIIEGDAQWRQLLVAATLEPTDLWMHA